MENKESIKSTYLVLFILGIIETVLSFFGGGVIGIAVLVFALILRSKLAKENLPATPGVKLMLIGSGIQIASLLFGLLIFIIALISIASNSSDIGVLFLNFIYYIFIFISFVILIIGCIFVYKEYDAIK